MNEWINRAGEAVEAVAHYCSVALDNARIMSCSDGKLDSDVANRRQHLLHSLAWIKTVQGAMCETLGWARRAQAAMRFREIDELVLRIGFGEYLAQLTGGIPMSQTEFARPASLGLMTDANHLAEIPACDHFLRSGNNAEARGRLVDLLRSGIRPDEALGDGVLDMVRDQFRTFTADRITPFAHKWHLQDALIPDAVIQEMAELGVFGICIEEKYGGLQLGKFAMCIVTEELSRGWICAGSLGTRSEIAGELIAANGLPEQKLRWLPGIAAGEILPTAVFTEPDVGSDLASVKTRGKRTSEGWNISGAKTWITHAARADLMTMLVRTDPEAKGHAGLSIILAGKSRRTVQAEFPDPGLDGSEIEVLGYRGMKEYALGFDNFRVAEDGLLGGVEGQGFKQLMATFEGARIQTAARAIGVAWCAFEMALRYATERKQFGQELADFPRVSDKLALMAAETVMARELTYSAARKKDRGERCDVEAGMAKLLAARVAWANADGSVQIHGGNGYALEYEASRILCDARILNIFEGAAEIQAHVIARGLIAAAAR